MSHSVVPQMTHHQNAVVQTVALGIDSFATLRKENIFYIDKTAFIREWWEAKDLVTLITRPRRFGKTLTMSMIECFFSIRYKGKGELFTGLEIWNDQKFQKLQGTLPVINLSFAGVKGSTFTSSISRICMILDELLSKHEFLLEKKRISEEDIVSFKALRKRLIEKDVDAASDVIHFLSVLMDKAEEKQVLILLDEYDAPLYEAWVYGYWKEMSLFMRNLLNFTFKSNSSLERGIITGVARVSKESMFSDFNNLRTVSVLTKGRYETSFGFTEEEVSEIMKKYNISDSEAKGMKAMYDGFVFGSQKGMYNPWSILSYLSSGRELSPWWANTSSNELIEQLLQTGSEKLHSKFVHLLQGQAISSKLHERIVVRRLENNPESVWTLLVEAGYLKPIQKEGEEYLLVITNGEVYKMLEVLVLAWFVDAHNARNEFTKAMLNGDIATMNSFMADIAQSTFSVFDTGSAPSKKQPERFYHGFVLGLILDLRERYYLWSNEESGDGRYDVMIEPKDTKNDDAFILEFKVIEPEKEENLIKTVESALDQIERKRYAAKLEARDIPVERIHKYAFAFCGKKVLIDDKSERGRNAYLAQ